MKLLLAFAVLSLVACQDSKNSRVELNLDNKPNNGVIGGHNLSNVQQASMTVGLELDGGHCSGSYIGNDTIVTAAHCVYPHTVERVYFNHEAGSFSCTPISQVKHPQWESASTPWYDVGIVKIRCKDDRFNKIKSYALDGTKVPGGRNYSAGYGATDAHRQGGWSYPNLNYLPLEEYDVSGISNDASISQEFRSDPTIQELISRVKEGSLFCYKSSIEQSVFFGDSGGPQYYGNPDGSYFLVGVNSIILSKTSDLSDLFLSCSTSIAYHRDWILAQ